MVYCIRTDTSAEGRMYRAPGGSASLNGDRFREGAGSSCANGYASARRMKNCGSLLRFFHASARRPPTPLFLSAR